MADLMNGAMPVYEVGRNDNTFGDGNFLWFILLIFFFGMGGNGFGFGGGGNAAAGESYIQNRFDTNSMINKLDGLTNGIADATYELNNSIKDSAYANAMGLNNVAAQMSQCCCETNRNIDSLKYDMANLFCETNHNIITSTAQILQAITQTKYEDIIREQQRAIDNYQYNSLMAAITAKTTTTA